MHLIIYLGIVMTSPSKRIPLSECPIASTPYRTPGNDESVTVVNPSTSYKDDSVVSLPHLRSTHKKLGKSVRHSLGHVALHTATPQRVLWTTQRTSRLFDLLTRPALLFAPSLGIRLPFNPPVHESAERRPGRLPMRKRNLPMDPDPCLLSVDGLIDCLYAIGNLVDQVYYDCADGVAPDQEDDFDRSPTMLAANYFRKRLKPALTRLNELRLQLSDFKMGECIGRGACGIVRVVREVAPPHSVYAMKSQYKGAWLHHDPEGFQIMLERTVLAQAAAIENPWLPHLHYAFQDEKQLHLVMDYEPGGDLYIFLSKVGHLLDAEMIQFYAAEAIEAIHSLHQMGYIHCDLKPENFAIERSGHLKLLDFGSAIRLDADGRCVCPTMVGTKEYLNIELLRQRGRHNEEPLLVGPEYDYWAIGVLLYELFYAQTPFYDEDDETMMQKIMDYKKTLKFPTGVEIPGEVVHLIKSLITTPAKRLTYEGVVRHSFFKNIDFSRLRQTQPPYLPPVGDQDDVSNFSGGGARTRDEAILDVSTNETFSPVRMKKSCPSSVFRSIPDIQSPLQTKQSQENIITANHSSVETVQDSVLLLNDQETGRAANKIHSSLEVSKSPTVLTTREAKEQAIREAAAVPVHEDIEEIEDIVWHGSECVRNLPFVGYTFTPGLVLLRNFTRGQTAASVAAGLGTSVVAAVATPFRPMGTVLRGNLDSFRYAAPSTPSIPCSVPDQCKPIFTKSAELGADTELLAKLSTLEQRNDQLQQQIQRLHTQQNERTEYLQNQISKIWETAGELSDIKGAVDKLPDSILDRSNAIFEQLVARIKQLHEKNSDLRNIVTGLQHFQSIVEQFRLLVSRLATLPQDFVETDITDTLRCIYQDGVAENPPGLVIDCDSASQDLSDANLVHRLVSFIIKQHRLASERIAEGRATVEVANRELKEAWEASRQQIGTLDVMVADQRRARECENRLNREIQDLQQKLADAKDYQRDLRNRYMEYEDKYFTARDRLIEETKKCSELKQQLHDVCVKKESTESLLRETNLKLDQLQSSHDNLIMIDHLRAELETTRMQTHLAEIERTNAEQREAQVREQLVDLEHQLNSSRHDGALLKDRYEKLKEAVATMEQSLMNYPSSTDNSELTAVQQQLALMNQEKRKLLDQVETLEMQLERLRVNNTQMASQRDSARQETRQLQAELLREKESNDVAQQAAQSEIFKLSTITTQQGKLINHMCSLLPPEHRHLSNAVTEVRLDSAPRRSFADPKRSYVKVTGHSLLKTAGFRNQKTVSQDSETGHMGGAPFIVAASAFFGRRRGGKHESASDFDDKPPRSETLMKQPSRLRKIVNRSRLRFKRRTTVSGRTGKLTQSDLEPELDFGDDQNNLVFTEDECTIGCYSPGSTDDGLPIPIPPGTLIRHESDAGDSLSNTDSISSAASTTESAPVGTSVTLPGTWQQRSHRGRHHVGWADKENIDLTQPEPRHKNRSQLKLLKQFSKVLSKPKPSGHHTQDS